MGTSSLVRWIAMAFSPEMLEAAEMKSLWRLMRQGHDAPVALTVFNSAAMPSRSIRPVSIHIKSPGSRLVIACRSNAVQRRTQTSDTQREIVAWAEYRGDGR